LAGRPGPPALKFGTSSGESRGSLAAYGRAEHDLANARREANAMRMGETLRYGAPKDPGPPTVDGLANFWHETVAPDGTRTQLEAGISPIGMVRAVEGPRTPAILIRSSPHKAGSEVTPWQDHFDPDHGHIRYFGDNKPTYRTGAEASPGNKSLLEAFSLHRAGTAGERAKAVPLVCFRGVPVNGVVKGHVQFCGVGLLWQAERVAQWDTTTGRSFANYLFDIVVLSLAAEEERLDWAWINRRRDPAASTRDCLQLAPRAWRDWVEGGAEALPRLRRSVVRQRTVKAAAQVPAGGSREAATLRQVLDFYDSRKHRFEALAELVAERVLRGTPRRDPPRPGARPARGRRLIVRPPRHRADRPGAHEGDRGCWGDASYFPRGQLKSAQSRHHLAVHAPSWHVACATT
jgi:hypothetical protein